jgi:hypothetical protein
MPGEYQYENGGKGKGSTKSGGKEREKLPATSSGHGYQKQGVEATTKLHNVARFPGRGTTAR